MAQVNSHRLLEFIGTLDLRVGLPDNVASYIEGKLDEVLSSERGLPDADPLRFDGNGKRLSRYALNKKLDGIIKSWPIAKGEWSARKKGNKSRL